MAIEEIVQSREYQSIIAIFLTNAYTTHAAMLRGILSYSRTHTNWALELKSGRRGEAPLADFDWSTCDGAFVYGTTPAILRRIRQRHLPVVLVTSDDVPSFPGCALHCDNAPIAATAAHHLLARHCAAYAFMHVPGMSWSRERGSIFADMIAHEGLPCRHASGRAALQRLIAHAPKPLGIFAADDIRAREVLDVCQAVGCSVPDDVVVLGVDDDETLCEMSNPTLSSIPLSSQDAGYRAAEILDRMLRGELSPEDHPRVTYTGTTVVERQSTARSFARDMLVRRCRDLLASDFASPLRVGDLARSLGVARRTLETHFRAVTGVSVADEITRLRIEHAKKLLATTSRTQERIALDCGFCDASHLGAVFRRHLGRAPSAWR